MLVALFHNAAAGSENHTAMDLVAQIERAGHTVAMATDSLQELSEAIASTPIELVAVAGGDGTLSLVTCKLEPLPCPIAILPLGTANDVALSLGLVAPVEELVATWQHGNRIPFNLGLLSFERTPPSVAPLRFTEAVGWGVFADLVSASEALPKREDNRARLRSDRSRFKEHLQTARPRTYAINADGHDLSGNYLLVEILNVSFIGPRLQLSKQSDPSDDLLELVLVGEGDRAALLSMLDAVPGSTDKTLTCIQATRIQIRSRDTCVHLDGDSLRLEGDHETIVSVEVAPQSTTLLVPQSTAMPLATSSGGPDTMGHQPNPTGSS